MSDETPPRQGSDAAPQKPEFDIIRTAAAPGSGGGNPMPLVLLVVVLALAGGGFVLFNRGDDVEPAVDPTTADAAESAPDAPVPEFVWERLAYLEGENLDRALVYAEEQLATYPNGELRSRIARYRDELGLVEDPRSAAELVGEAYKALQVARWDDALELAELALEKEPEHATAYFVSGYAKGELGQKLAAQNDLRSALELGYRPAAEAQAHLDRFSK